MNDRSLMTFAQAEGLEALPTQLQLRTISPELSARLWLTTYNSLTESISNVRGVPQLLILTMPWQPILTGWWVERQFKNIDEFPDPRHIMAIVKEIVTGKEYVRLFDFIQYVVRHAYCPSKYRTEIAAALENSYAAYRLIDQTIVPISSDEMAESLTRSMQRAEAADAKGPRAHLKNAAESLSQGNWAQSIRESIHAVEAAARSIEPDASTLGPALANLQKKCRSTRRCSEPFLRCTDTVATKRELDIP